MNLQYVTGFDDDEDPSDVRLSCFIHTLQLTVRDGLKNSSFILKVLSKCQTLAKIAHKSSTIADILDEFNKNISKMNVTRWSSEYLFIKSIFSIGRNDLEIITSLMENPVKFTDKDFIILGEFIDILEPFHDITIKCQAELAVTASFVVPSIVHLFAHLRDIKENVSYCSKFIQQLHDSIKNRFSGIMDRLSLVNVDSNANFGDPLYFIAAVLDPSFKFFWIRDLQLSAQVENRLKNYIIELIVNEMSKDSRTTTAESSNLNSSSMSSSCSTSSPKLKRRKLFNYEDFNLNDSNESSTLDPSVELDAYLTDPIRAKFSDYWFHSKLNVLKQLVIRIFSVQASSAPTECVFSHAGLILSSRRTKLNEDLFRNLVLLRVNQHLL